MQSVVDHRDHAKPGLGRRAVLRGQAVYRIQRTDSENGFGALPAESHALQAGLEHLAASGIDVLWLASTPGHSGTSYGRCLSHITDLAAAQTLPASLRAVVEVGISAGLRVLADLQELQVKPSRASLTYVHPLPKQACYRWADVPKGNADLDSAVTDGVDLLRIARCQDWLDQECRAPFAHAALTQVHRLYGRGWPLWLVCAQWLHPGTQAAAVDPRLLALALALPLCLKGSPLLDHPPVGGLQEVPFSIARFLRWRRTIPALRYGKMQLLAMHENLLMFTRQDGSQCVLCVFNLSERFVRQRLPATFARFSLIAGSGLEGGRIVDRDIDCDPWGALFAQQYDPLPLKSF